MTRICVLDNQTNKCINVLELDNESDWTDHHTFIKASRSDGEIGWILLETGEWDTGIIPETIEEKIIKERQRRDKYLSMNIDALNGPRWESMSQEQKDAWIEYRQLLLDVPQQVGFPENIVWPVQPQSNQPAVPETVEVLPVDEPIVPETVEVSQTPPTDSVDV